MEEKEIIRGGQFIVKESNCEDIFTPEDFTEEQKMMKDAVMEFNDREIIPFRDRFENKDYAFTEEIMRKAGALGFLRFYGDFDPNTKYSPAKYEDGKLKPAENK